MTFTPGKFQTQRNLAVVCVAITPKDRAHVVASAQAARGAEAGLVALP
jgi:hypothetical protein